MSGPTNPIKPGGSAYYPPRHPSLTRDSSSPLTDRTDSVAKSSIQPHERPCAPLRRRTHTSKNQEKTNATYNRKKKTTTRPAHQNTSRSWSQRGYLLIVGICALIGALLYGLFRGFSTQSVVPKPNIVDPQKQPQLNINKSDFEDFDRLLPLHPVQQNGSAWEELSPEVLAQSKREAKLPAETMRKREEQEFKAIINSLPTYVLDKNVYGSRPLDSIKTALMGFENPHEPLAPLSEEVAEQIDTLKGPSYNIGRWRPIAGDGNCYYRASMFGLIEQIIQNRNRERFNELASIFERISPLLPRANKSSHENFIAHLKSAASGSDWTTLNDFKRDIVDLNTGLDKSMVRAARYLVARELEGMAGQTDEHGITIEDLIENESLESYCARIRILGQYAEGPHVNMNLLSHLLDFSLTLHTAAGAGGLFTLKQEGNLRAETEVSILLIPERQHYVLIYPKAR